MIPEMAEMELAVNINRKQLKATLKIAKSRAEIPTNWE